MRHPRYTAVLLGMLAMTAAASLARAESIRNPYYDHLKARISNLRHEIAEVDQQIAEAKELMLECKREADTREQNGWAIAGTITSAFAGVGLIGRKAELIEVLRELRSKLEDVPLYVPESDYDYWFDKIR